MKNLSNPENVHRQSTYQLLVESEERERSACESVAYLMLIVATTVSFWQFTQQPVNFPGNSVASARPAAAINTPVLRS